MKSSQTMTLRILSLLTFAAIAGAGSPAYAGDPLVPAAPSTESQGAAIKSEKKGHRAAHKKVMTQYRADMKGVFEEYHGQIENLKTQRKEAVKAGNQEQMQSLKNQIQALKKERQGKTKEIRAEMQAAKEKARGKKKAAQEEKKQ